MTKQYQSLNMHIGLAHTLKQLTEARLFRERWQLERGILEGDLGTSANVDLIENFLSNNCCTSGTTDSGFKLLLAVLRLLCLQSLVGGGIRASKFDATRRLIIQTFGYRHAITIRNLEKAGESCCDGSHFFFLYRYRRHLPHPHRHAPSKRKPDTHGRGLCFCTVCCCDGKHHAHGCVIIIIVDSGGASSTLVVLLRFCIERRQQCGPIQRRRRDNR